MRLNKQKHAKTKRSASSSVFPFPIIYTQFRIVLLVFVPIHSISIFPSVFCPLFLLLLWLLVQKEFTEACNNCAEVWIGRNFWPESRLKSEKNLVLSSPKFLCSVPRNFQVLTNLMDHRYIWNSYSFQIKGIKNPAKVELTAQPRAHTHHHWQTNPYLSTDVRAQTSVKMHLACAFPLGINKVCLP